MNYAREVFISHNYVGLSLCLYEQAASWPGCGEGASRLAVRLTRDMSVKAEWMGRRPASRQMRQIWRPSAAACLCGWCT